MLPTVYLITPLTQECEEWLKETSGEDAIYLGRSLAIEHRYVDYLVAGLEKEGFKYQRDFEIMW